MPHLMNQPSAMPTRKVTAATLGALVGALTAQIVIAYLPDTVDLGTLSILLETLFVAAATAIPAYFTRDRAA